MDGRSKFFVAITYNVLLTRRCGGRLPQCAEGQDGTPSQWVSYVIWCDVPTLQVYYSKN